MSPVFGIGIPEAGVRLVKIEERSDAPDWDGECELCGQTPIVPSTGMCGPCTFGEADTAGGNW